MKRKKAGLSFWVSCTRVRPIDGEPYDDLIHYLYGRVFKVGSILRRVEFVECRFLDSRFLIPVFSCSKTGDRQRI